MSSCLSWLTVLLLTTTPVGAVIYNVTVNGNATGASCVFPFIYQGVVQSSCITAYYTKPWCSTTSNYDVDRKWGECLDYDVCQNHQNLSDPWRNIGFSSISFSTKDDANLSSGWYEFSGIGGDRMVHYCSDTSVTVYSYLTSEMNSTNFTPYPCNSVYWSRAVMCAQQNISTLNCDGGVTLYYLVPTSGMYATRHSFCNASSCGRFAQCGLPYGSCECMSGLSIPDDFLPTGDSYGCTGFIIKQSDQCKASLTADCAEDLLNQFKDSTASVIPENVLMLYLEKVLNATKVLNAQTVDQTKMLNYGNSICNATENLLSVFVKNTSVNLSSYSIALQGLEVQVLVGPKSKKYNFSTSTASLDIDLAEINGTSAMTFINYGNLLNAMLNSSLFNAATDTVKTMMSTVVSARLLNISNKQLTRPIDFTFTHSQVAGGNLSCVCWKDTKWVVDGCTVSFTNKTHTVCTCNHLSTFALIMESNSLKNVFNLPPDQALDEILNSPVLVLPQEVVVNVLGKVMNDTLTTGATTGNQVEYASKVLKATERLVSALVVNVETYKAVPIVLPNLEAQVVMVGPNASMATIPPLNTSTANLYIDLITIAKNNKGSAAVSFILYFTNLLDPSLFNTTEQTVKTMMSPVVTATLVKISNTTLPSPVNFTFKHTAELDPNGTLSCVYWSNTTWSEDGCSLIQTNINETVCSCVHLSTFALIMQTNPTDDDPYDLYNTIAVSVGLVSLSLALLTFALCRRHMKVNISARINLCISLFLAHLLFLLTQKFLEYIKPLQLLCAVIAGVLHFLFLSAFVWMFIEAVLLFISVKNLTKIRSKKKEELRWPYLIVIGYIIPLVIVGVSVGLFPDGYGSDKCWIKRDRDFLWSFLGPVCFILTVNVLLSIFIIITLRATLAGMNSQQTQLKQIKILIFKSLLQIAILGSPWILGFFTKGSSILMILFLLLNSQQGTFIFLVHCVLNQEIRQQYREWITCTSKNQKKN